MARMTTYRSRSTVRARKVGAKGEDVVTDAGRVYAPPGMYVVEDNGRTYVQDAESFESGYVKSSSGKKTRKSASASDSDTPPVVAGTKGDDAKTPDPVATARARVAATKAARKG